MEPENNNEKIIDMDQDMEDNGEEDFEISWYGGNNEEDDKFDEFVGSLQDIVISDEFESLQNSFFQK